MGVNRFGTVARCISGMARLGFAWPDSRGGCRYMSNWLLGENLDFVAAPEFDLVLDQLVTFAGGLF